MKRELDISRGMVVPRKRTDPEGYLDPRPEMGNGESIFKLVFAARWYLRASWDGMGGISHGKMARSY